MMPLYALGENWFKTYNLLKEPFVKDILKTAKKSNNNFLIPESEYYKLVRFIEESRNGKKFN